MKRLSLALSCITLWLALGWTSAFAQDPPPDLIVVLHDVQGAPIAGATVIVRDGSGTRELARTTSDARGVASFTQLAERQVRVAVAGTLPNGARLYQPGADAPGIALLLDSSPAALDLRSERDGMVRPDPATMAALEQGVPVATQAAPVPRAPIAPEWIGRAPLAPMAKPAERGQGPLWLGVGALITLVGAGIGIVMMQRRSA